MYFDPDWIFQTKPEKSYPNITGLVPEGKPEKKVLTSMADVFPVRKMQPVSATPIPTTEQSLPDYLDKRGRNWSIMDMQRNEFAKEFSKRALGGANYITFRPGLNINPAHQERYFGRDNPSQGDATGAIRILDPKYNIRNNLMVSPDAIEEIRKYAQAGKLTPEQTLLLAAISSNESEFGTTRDLFGINDLYQDFPGGTRQLPGSYEAKKLMERYTGDQHTDVINWLKRKTENFTDIERMNPGFQNDRELNPQGERYTDRVNRNMEILLGNPEFIKALFGGQIPAFNFPDKKAQPIDFSTLKTTK